MQFPEHPRRPPPESIVPMINVVFLLLIFFLMTARIAPPPPFEVTPPRLADAGAAPHDTLTLHLSAAGEPAFGAARGERAALAALAEARAAACGGTGCDGDAAPALTLRADAAAPGARLAALLPQLARMGFARVELVTQPR